MCLALMVASLVETVFVTNMCRSNYHSPVPRWVRVIVLQLLGCLVFLHSKPSDTEDATIENPAAEGERRLPSFRIRHVSSFPLQQNQRFPF